MMTQIKHFLAPPVFENDEEKSRVASLLNIILWGTLIMESLRSLIFVFIPNITLLVSLIATAGVVAIAGSLLFLLHRGYVSIASFAFLSLIWAGVTALNTMYGGVRGAGYVVYIEIIVASGLLLGTPGIVAFALASILSGLALFVLENQGLISPDLSMLAAEIAFGTVSQVFVVVSLLIALYHQGFLRAITQARALSRVLTEKNLDLEAIRTSLEDKVEARTRSAEQARQESETANAALQAQIWQFAGLAQLNDVMQGEQDVPTLAQNIIYQLCAYLDAPVGLLYLMKDSVLHLTGTYAYHPGDSEASQTFILGEGLVGQVALEQQTRILNDVSTTSLRITSTLGESLPRQIVIYPFLFNTRVSGVIELGTTQPVSKSHLEFLNAAATNIAIALNTAQTRARVNMLLEETQQQTQELQAQEEELRAANEELEAQAENLRLSEARLQEKQIELESLNAELRQQSRTKKERGNA